MKLGLSSLLFVRNTIEEAIRINSELGAECVEIIYDVPHFPPNYDLRKLASIKELLGSYGLGVSVHGSFWDLNPASHHRKLWELSLEQMRKSIDACRMLGGGDNRCAFRKVSGARSPGTLKGIQRTLS
ncbi:MAG TPA: sugar phosphate isomerase/epimerase [Hadesarchaea archaeon]|nr:sugar phosphate isomerase/epimerase [Hadesarchaea archaeon]